MRGYVTVDVDIDDVLGEIDTDDLRKELAARDRVKLAEATSAAGVSLSNGEIEELVSSIREMRLADALALIERVTSPRFRSLDLCMLQFAKLPRMQRSDHAR